jgi:hypothetical protein
VPTSGDFWRILVLSIPRIWTFISHYSAASGKRMKMQKSYQILNVFSSCMRRFLASTGAPKKIPDMKKELSERLFSTQNTY